MTSPGGPVFTPAEAAFGPLTRESFARQGAMALLGARLERIEPGLCEIAADYRPELSQQHGFFHAGVVAAIADSAGGYAAFSLFRAGEGVLSVEFKISLLAPADGERIVARGEVVRPGKSITVSRFDVFADRGGRRTHCATGLATLMRMVGRPGVTG